MNMSAARPNKAIRFISASEDDSQLNDFVRGGTLSCLCTYGYPVFFRTKREGGEGVPPFCFHRHPASTGSPAENPTTDAGWRTNYGDGAAGLECAESKARSIRV